MSHRTSLIVSLVLLGCASFSACAATVRVATDAAFPPFHFVADDGAITGFDIELVRTALARSGHEVVVIRTQPYATLFEGLDAGRHDVVAATTGITPERQRLYGFSRPYYETCQAVVVRRGPGEPASLIDLAGRRVLTSTGGTSHRAARRLAGAIVVEKAKGADGTAALRAKEVDALVLDEFEAVALGRTADLRVIDRPAALESYGFVTRQADAALRREIDAALASMEADGTTAALRERFGIARDADWPVALGTLPPPDAEGWIPLFNGRDLTGWTPKFAGFALGTNICGTFRVHDDAIDVTYRAYDRFNGAFGHLFYRTPCSSYRLRLQYRFTGDLTPGAPGWAFRNSGVMVHGQAPETMRKDQPFPVSIEVQLLGGDGTNERHTGNLCTPGTHVEMDGSLVTRHCIDSSSKTYHGDRWVTMEIEVRGGAVIRHLIDGAVVLEYQRPQLDPGDDDARAWIDRRGGTALLEGGTISLQAEGHACAFRKIELLPLAPTRD